MLQCSPSQGYPPALSLPVPIYTYTWVERGTVRVKCLAQDHNTMSPARVRPGPHAAESNALTMRPPCLPALVRKGKILMLFSHSFKVLDLNTPGSGILSHKYMYSTGSPFEIIQYVPKICFGSLNCSSNWWAKSVILISRYKTHHPQNKPLKLAWLPGFLCTDMVQLWATRAGPLSILQKIECYWCAEERWNEHRPFFHFWHHHFWPKLPSSILNFWKRKRSFQQYPDQSDWKNGAWDMYKNAQKDEWIFV